MGFPKKVVPPAKIYTADALFGECKLRAARMRIKGNEERKDVK